MQSLPRRLILALAIPVALTGTVAGLKTTLDTFGATDAPQVAATPVSNPLSALGVAPAAVDAVQSVAADLRSKLHYVPVRVGAQEVMTPDPASRLLLVQSAARRADLAAVGLSYRDVYGLINAETSWLPRTGVGRTGTPSFGLAQFEPGTAKALGLQNPNDPVDAVYAAALNMKNAASWAAHKLAALKLPPQVYAQKLREGVSVYYNLSSRGRKLWNGLNTAKLPIETQRHIANSRIGAEYASALAAQLEGEGVVG